MNQTLFANDRVVISRRTVTDEGYLVAPGILARTGIQEYRAYELGLDADGVDPMKLIRLYRPPEEVFEPASMASFDGKPITIEHPPVAVTADNWKDLAVGDVRGIRRDGDFMTATLTIRSRDAIEALESGKRELSNGYSFTLDQTPGATPEGHAYDAVQRNIRGNHVALVDAARCGSACRVADSSNHQKGNKPMPDALRKVVVDGIPVEVSETAAAAIDKLTQARDKALADLEKAPRQTALDALAAEVKTLKDSVAAKDAEIEALKKDVITPEARDALVAEWARLIAEAKRLAPTIATDGKTCLAIRREVIGALVGKDATAKAVADAVLAGKAVADAEPETVRAAFNALAAAVKTSAADAETVAHDAAVADALTGSGKANDAKAELTGRDKFLARQSQAWQQ